MVFRYKSIIAGAVLATLGMSAHATSITLKGGASAADMVAAILGTGSGITVVAGSESYTGLGTQSGFSSDFSYSNGTKTISTGDGIVLTSGDAGGIEVADNTDPSFDGFLGTAGDADLTTLSGATTNDANILEFDFMVGAGVTSVSADFIFGSDEFPDQSVPDIFGFFIDGVNFAKFSDGSLISFAIGSPSAAFFNDNDVGNPSPFVDADGDEIQYDGITDELMVTGILAAGTVHTAKIAIADTNDSIFDSAVFIGNLMAGTSSGGGGIGVPAPAGIVLFGLALLGLGAARRR